jgi:hypothetical protein
MKADPIRLVEVDLARVTEPRNDGTPGSALYQVPIRLSRTPSWTWENAFLKAWQFPRQFTSMHRPGIARIDGDCIVLDGTTIEEVRDTHRATLVLCVEDANQAER